MVARLKVARGKSPAMRVGIFNGRRLIRVVELPDPRAAFCKAWQELEKQDGGGMVAKPLVGKAVKS